MHGNALASHTSEKLGFLDSKNAAYFGLVSQKVTNTADIYKYSRYINQVVLNYNAVVKCSNAV